MWRKRDVVKVEPDLPEPATQPPAFLARSPDRLFVQRRLPSGRVKVDDGDQSRLGCEHVVDAIEQSVKVGDLAPIVSERAGEHAGGETTHHGEGVAEGDKVDAALGLPVCPLRKGELGSVLLEDGDVSPSTTRETFARDGEEGLAQIDEVDRVEGGDGYVLVHELDVVTGPAADVDPDEALVGVAGSEFPEVASGEGEHRVAAAEEPAAGGIVHVCLAAIKLYGGSGDSTG